MAGKPDAGLRAIIRQHLRHIGQWVSIETGLTEQGVPDTNVITRAAGGGRECWIECKRAEAWAVKFKPAQVGWLYTRWRYGGNAFVFTRRLPPPKRQLQFDDLYITSAEHVRELSQHGLQRVPHLLIAEGGPGQWPWEEIEGVLRRMR
jgi:hypothetical protein